MVSPPPTPVEAEGHAQSHGRRRAVMLTLCGVAVGLAWAATLGPARHHGESLRFLTWLGVVLVLSAGWGMVWRCPRCRQRLGRRLDVARCPTCGLELAGRRAAP